MCRILYVLSTAIVDFVLAMVLKMSSSIIVLRIIWMTIEFPIEMTMRKHGVFVRIERDCYGIENQSL